MLVDYFAYPVNEILRSLSVAWPSDREILDLNDPLEHLTPQLKSCVCVSLIQGDKY
jgi:hypothetical protein